MSKRIGVYPGTFDPITNGHTDIIRRALHVVDHLLIGVARNDAKGPLFSTDERVEIVRDEMSHLDNGSELHRPAATRVAAGRAGAVRSEAPVHVRGPSAVEGLVSATEQVDRGHTHGFAGATTVTCSRTLIWFKSRLIAPIEGPKSLAVSGRRRRGGFARPGPPGTHCE